MDAARLHRLVRKLTEVSRAATTDPGEPGVGVSELAIIEDVSARDGTTVSEITARTGLAQSYVSRTAAKLREAGVFTTAPDPADGRRVLLRIAPAVRQEVFRARGALPIDAALAATVGDAGRVPRIIALLEELAGQLLGEPDVSTRP